MPGSSPLSSNPPSLTSGPTIPTSPTAEQPPTPTDLTPKPQPLHQHPTTRSNSSTPLTFDPASPADRELARAAGMRIDTPTPYPRLLLEPHLTIELDHRRFAHNPALLDRAAAALLARHGGSKLLIRTTNGPDDADTNDPDAQRWATRRRQARTHRAAHPISVASTRGAFAASIGQLPRQRQQQQQQQQRAVSLPAGYLATEDRALSATEAAALQQLDEGQIVRAGDRGRRLCLPLFVYGHWMFPTQMAGAVLAGGGAGRGEQPAPEVIEQWTQRMLPASLLNDDDDGGGGGGGGGWHRYCMRGASPTAALLERNDVRLRYYLRDVGDHPPPVVEGRLVLGMSAEEWECLDRFLQVAQDGDGEGEGGQQPSRMWGKREVQVSVRVAQEGQGLAGTTTTTTTTTTTRLRAVAYVWEGNPMELHIFKMDKVWTPELYVEWHGRMRKEMAAAAVSAEGDSVV
ncbi:uncharacterized protein BKCO1_5800057 [Diplodia corticola]|uniref:Uncharacterized protein n=1 Tax=Diplodia corticola TaxID=236234 RepID=A0A1J9QQ70_9PEZI|nr:uncharacterized protein BKCO1_5800057 [Diplodia corticola]OJD30601.1 hypothetical protein BKCO1_5800057 [Diplodia corticola]